MSGPTIYKGAVAPESVVMRIDGQGLQAVSAAVIKVARAGQSPASWTADQIDRDDKGVTLTHVFQNGETDTVGDYNAVAYLTVPGGTIRSEPQPFTIEDPFA